MARLTGRRSGLWNGASPLALLTLVAVTGATAAIATTVAAQQTDASGALVLPTLSVEEQNKATPLDRKTASRPTASP